MQCPDDDLVNAPCENRDATPPPHTLKLPRHRLRIFTKRLLDLRPHPRLAEPPPELIKVVCISDTHNAQPALPHGDLLIHAGDLSEWGSFDEIQSQLTWLASQPHTHKVVIAGNHDVLFDADFLASHTHTFPLQTHKTAAHLVFGDVVYLENQHAVLSFPHRADRTLTLYGSPLTPKYLDSAFQHPRDEDVWRNPRLDGVDVLVTHGPPWGHLDGGRRAGCPHLAHAVAGAKPPLRLVVCGHIHVGRGREVVRYDGLQRAFEEVDYGWRGPEAVPLMLLRLAWMRVRAGLRLRGVERLTEIVNAAVVGEGKGVCNEAVVTYI